jgi:hypothetical protein
MRTTASHPVGIAAPVEIAIASPVPARPHRVAVHRGVVEGRDRLGARHVLREHAPKGVIERYVLGPQRPSPLEHRPPGDLDVEQFPGHLQG